MADNDDVSASPGGDEAPAAAAADEPTTAAPAPPVLKTRWRDRAWTFRAMLAVAAASLVIGGVAGGVVGAVAGGDEDHQRMGRWGPAGEMPPGWQGHGPRGDGGPQWRWNDGPNNGPGAPMTPFGNGDGTTPQPSSPTPSPSAGSTG